MKSFISTTTLLAASLFTTALAQQPKIEHAQLTTRSDGDLQGAIAATIEPGWVGYSETTSHPMNNNWDDGVQYLEGRPDSVTYEDRAANSSDASSLVVLLRVIGGRVSKIKISELQRVLDAGGLPFVWVNGVSESASIHTLAGVAEQGITSAPDKASPDNAKSFASSRSTAETAMVAIALHSAPEATATLRSFTTDRNPGWARERAAFWLANERGAEGFEAVKAMMRADHDEEVRSKLTFDLTLVKGASRSAAVDELINTARNDSSEKVRKQAQFWLAQQVSKGNINDPRITDTLRQQAANDPNAAIRKSAVFALSRLPGDQAATELIRVASTTSDPTTKREAVFWLGQSKDPHALDYLEKLAKQ